MGETNEPPSYADSAPSTDSVPPTRAQYVKLMSAVYVATFLIRISFGIVLVAFAKYVPFEAYFHRYGDFAYGAVISLAPLLELITVVYAGVAVERHGRRKVLLAGLLIAVIANAGIALTTNVPVVALVNGLHGIAAALIIVPSLAILSDATPAHARGREMGTFNFVNVFGWVLGFAIGFALLDVFSGNLRWTFVTGGFLALAGYAYARYAIADETRAAGDTSHDVRARDIRHLVRHWDVVLTIAPFFVLFFIASAGLLGPKGTASDEDFRALRFGGFVLLGGLVFLVSQVVLGKLSDKYGRDPFLVAGGVGLLVIALTVAVALGGDRTLTFSQATARIRPFWPILAPASIGLLAFAPAGLAAVADVAQKHSQGLIMGLFTLTMSAGLILGAPTMGLAVSLFGTAGFAFTLIACGIAFLALVVARFVYDKRVAASAADPSP